METLYHLVHYQLYNKYGQREITIKQFKGEILGRHFHIDKYYSCIILKEMINLGMIKQVNNRIIEIIPSNFDKEINKNKLASQLGIF
jgi:hypothetical protein